MENDLMPLKRWKSLYEKYHRKYNIYVNIGVCFSC